MNKEYGFEKGWYQLTIRDTKKCRERIMKALNLNTSMAFYQRMHGRVEPKVSEAKAVEAVFHSFGIKEIWGAA